jgi:hypothetical protein
MALISRRDLISVGAAAGAAALLPRRVMAPMVPSLIGQSPLSGRGGHYQNAAAIYLGAALNQSSNIKMFT